MVLAGYRPIVKLRFIPEVEALRGIAALSVVFEHTVAPATTSWLHILFNGRGAVVLFFVMSGFALSCQLAGHVPSAATYARFIVRRLFRLFPTVWVAVALAWLVSKQPISGHEIMANGLLYSFNLNGPFWTLYVELWCSVAFPFVLWAGRWRLALLPLLLVPPLLLPTDIKPLMFEWSRYLFCFAMGVVAADIRVRLPAWVLKALGLVTVILAGMTSNLILQSVLYSALLVIVLNAPIACLRWRPVKFIGLVSFGIYAFHSPVSKLVLSEVGHNATLATFEAEWFVATVVCSVGLAALSGWLVERPLNDLGRRLTMKWKVKKEIK